MRTFALWGTLATMALFPLSLGGQDRARMATTSEQAERAVFSTLFEGISLSRVQEDRARAIISDEMRQQLALDRRDPQVFDKRIRLNFVRDSTLKTLLTRPEDIARFERQSERIRPQPLRRP